MYKAWLFVSEFVLNIVYKAWLVVIEFVLSMVYKAWLDCYRAESSC